MQNNKTEGNFLHTGQELQTYEYRRELGAYKAKFQGIPEDYYPLTTCEGILYSLIVLFIIGAMLGLMIGFLFWVTALGLQNYIIAWSIIFLVFTLVLIIAFYFGGKSRIRAQKQLIQQSQKRQQESRKRKQMQNI